MKKKTIIVTEEDVGLRADVVLAKYSGLTRSYVKKLCDDGLLLINGKLAKSNKGVKLCDELTLSILDNVELDLEPENIPLDIIYKDDDIAVINKPQGMTVHAGNGTNGSTLVNALLYHLNSLSGINGVIRPGIVHRIDKNTSGLLVVAKNDKSHLALAKQLEDKTCSRIYVALLEGVLKTDKGVIETFIGRNPNERTKMAVLPTGRLAITEYKVIKRYDGFTLCEFSLKTGRTHQIRVHAKHLGHPVVGDKEYGYKNQKFKLDGQLLHARKLTFMHPTLGEKVSFECGLPEYFVNVLKKLREI